MSVYVVLLPRGETARPEPRRFDAHLPFDPEVDAPRVQVVDRPAGRLIVWQWDAQLDRPVEDGEEGVLFVQGYGDQEGLGLEDRLRQALPKRILPSDSFGSYAAVYLDDGGGVAYLSLTGMDAIYKLETPELVCLSNRMALLAPLASSLTHRREAIVSLCGRTHLTDFGCLYEEVSRVVPGEMLIVESGTTRTLRQPLPFGGEMDLRQSHGRLRSVLEQVVYPLKKCRRPLRLHLSGGKDSRAILALLDLAGLVGPELEVTTYGHRHNPEVLAAEDLVALYEAPPVHVVKGPSTSYDSSALARMVISTSFAWEGLMSLADWTCYSRRVDRLSVGGHELGMKDPVNRRDLESYLDRPRFDVDHLRVLREDERRVVKARYADLLGAFLKYIPIAKYEMAEGWYLRNQNFVVHTFLSRNPADNQYHPFMDIAFARYTFSCPSEMGASQFLHWLIMKEASVDLQSVPFAGDAWPTDIWPLARSLDLGTRGIGVAPYPFDARFPVTPRRGLYPWRLDMLRLAKAFMHRSQSFARMDFLDPERTERLIASRPEEASLDEIYAILGIFNAALQLHYGAQLLDRSKGSELERDLLDVAGVQAPSVFIQEEGGDEGQDLERFDRALASFVRENRQLKHAEDRPSHALLSSPPRPSDELRFGFRRLGQDGWTVCVSLARPVETLSFELPMVTARDENNRAGLLCLRVDGAPLSAPGFKPSPDPQIGFFCYLRTTYGAVVPFVMHIPLRQDARQIEVDVRPWMAHADVWMGRPVVSAHGEQLEAILRPRGDAGLLRWGRKARSLARRGLRRIRDLRSK